MGNGKFRFVVAVLARISADDEPIVYDKDDANAIECGHFKVQRKFNHSNNTYVYKLYENGIFLE